MVNRDFLMGYGAGRSAGGGGGSSSVLVAHATVSELPSPGAPVSITPDKTFAELTAESYSVVELKVTDTEWLYYIPLRQTILYSDGVTPATLVYAIEEAGSYIEIEVETSGAALVTVRNPAFEPLVLTSTNFDMATMTGAIDQQVSTVEAAIESYKRIYVELFGVKAELTLVDTNSPTTELMSSTFLFDTGALAGVVLAKAIIYADNSDPGNPVLMLRAQMYTATPVT